MRTDLWAVHGQVTQLHDYGTNPENGYTMCQIEIQPDNYQLPPMGVTATNTLAKYLWELTDDDTEEKYEHKWYIFDANRMLVAILNGETGAMRATLGLCNDYVWVGGDERLLRFRCDNGKNLEDQKEDAEARAEMFERLRTEYRIVSWLNAPR